MGKDQGTYTDSCFTLNFLQFLESQYLWETCTDLLMLHFLIHTLFSNEYSLFTAPENFK